MDFSPWIVVVFSIYFALLGTIAVVRSRRLRSMSDFVLGGRALSAIAAGLSASSSATSAWTMMVFPALAFADGTVHVWTAVSVVIGVWVSWTVIARRLRRFTIMANDALTLPEFLEARFCDHTGALRAVSALTTIFLIVAYIASGLIAGSKLLETTLKLDATAGIMVTLVVITTYTFIGGFLAVSRTDVLQSSIMLLALGMIPLTLIAVTDNVVGSIGDGTRGFANPFTGASGEKLGPAFIFTTFGWGIGFLGAQRVLARYMALEREDMIGRSRAVGATWIALIFLSGLVIGVVARPALHEADLLDQVADPEQIYIVIAHGFFHPILVGVLLTAVVAAVKSTADSQLLLASAIATSDLPILRRLVSNLDVRSSVWVGRGMLIVVGLTSAALAIFQPASVFHMVALAWGGMGAAFGPITILSLYWRRFNFWGAMASMVSGTLAAALWWQLHGGPGDIWDIHPGTPGFLSATLVGVLVTLMTPQPSQQVVAQFDNVTRTLKQRRDHAEPAIE